MLANGGVAAGFIGPVEDLEPSPFQVWGAPTGSASVQDALAAFLGKHPQYFVVQQSPLVLQSRDVPAEKADGLLRKDTGEIRWNDIPSLQALTEFETLVNPSVPRRGGFVGSFPGGASVFSDPLISINLPRSAAKTILIAIASAAPGTVWILNWHGPEKPFFTLSYRRPHVHAESQYELR